MKNKKQNNKLNQKKRTPKLHEKKPLAKPGNMLYPIPAVLVSCRDEENDKNNVFTVGWTGTICTNPPMLSISVRKSRLSHEIISKSGEFVVNLTTEKLAFATDYCGVKSGRDTDKFANCNLTPEDSEIVACPGIKESPVSIECKVKQVLELGSHDMFVAEVVSVNADSAYFDESGRFNLEDSRLLVYSHGGYYSLGKRIGKFGWSVRKKEK